MSRGLPVRVLSWLDLGRMIVRVTGSLRLAHGAAAVWSPFVAWDTCLVHPPREFSLELVSGILTLNSRILALGRTSLRFCHVSPFVPSGNAMP